MTPTFEIVQRGLFWVLLAEDPQRLHGPAPQYAAGDEAFETREEAERYRYQATLEAQWQGDGSWEADLAAADPADDPICDCGSPASAHSGGGDDFSHCPEAEEEEDTDSDEARRPQFNSFGLPLWDISQPEE